MGDLPECGLTLSNKPFKFCGMDYLGPCLYREGRSNRKAWCLLMTCLCTRCIHVEVVASLDLDSLLLAFSRFVNLRGPVDTVYSDNGSTFRAAGGAWEIMVKLFKKALNQTIENTRCTPTNIELQTSVIEAVRIVNDRPLNAVSDQPNDLSLSPNTPICGFYDKGDLRKDFLHNATLAHRFWLL